MRITAATTTGVHAAGIHRTGITGLEDRWDGAGVEIGSVLTGLMPGVPEEGGAAVTDEEETAEMPV